MHGAKPVAAREPRIWSSVVRGLIVPLAEHDIDSAALLDCVGITEGDLQKPHGKIALRKYLQFIDEASIWAEDPLLGLRLARSAGPETLGAIGFLFLASRTLVEALNNICQYINLMQDVTRVTLTHNAQNIIYSYEIFDVESPGMRQDVEFSIALTSRLIRIYGGPAVSLSQVRFRHAAAGPVETYERLLAAPTRFNQPSNSLVVSARLGQLRGNVLDHGLSRILQTFLDSELEKRQRSHSFVDQVRRMLMESSIAPPVTAAKIAGSLGVSEATFYRRLKAEGRAFSDLVSELNFEIATNYLRESTLSITEIAYLIGFSESASFTRAFTRWSGGVTPSAFRKNARRTASSKKADQR